MQRYSTRRRAAAPSPIDLLAAAERVATANAEKIAIEPTAPGEVLLDARGYRRSLATFPEFHRGREPRNKGKEYKPNPPTVTEIMAMLRACPDTIYGRRIFAAILLDWQAALRIAEMLALVADDLDRESGAIQIRHGKGDKPGTIKMAAWAWDLLDEWLTIRATLPEPRGAVFCVVTGPTAGRAWSYADALRKLHEIAHAAGVTKRISWHQLRHAWAAWSFVDGVDVRTVQLQLRHDNLGTTDLYLRGLGVSHSQDQVHQAPVPQIPATALLGLQALKGRSRA